MSRSSRETEVKLRFDSPASALESLSALGARLVAERSFEDNNVYDRDGSPLRESGRLLRVRRSAGRAVVTYKEPVPGEHRHKVRREEEIVVQDPETFERILAGLEFRPVYRYQKYRTHFRLGELDLFLDETPIGCFLELEGSAEAIDRAAVRLGVDASDYVLETYREIHERDALARGHEPGDLVFEPADRRSDR